MITCLLSAEELSADSATITGDSYRHLFRARRLAAGDRLRVVDGLGNARWARIDAVEGSRAILRLGAVAPLHEARLRLELSVASPRPERASWLVEKATELGVHALHFLNTERAPREMSDSRLERLRRVAASALEQCHGSRLPGISGARAWSSIADLLATDGLSVVLDPSGGPWPDRPPSPRDSAAGQQEGGTCGEATDVAVFVGPEGGWTAAELARLVELGCLPVSLGPRMLRIETAALAAAIRWLVA